MVKTIKERMDEVIKDPKITKEQLVFFENRLWENQALSDTKTIRFLFFFAIASIVWFLTKSASIEKLSFFGIELVDLSIPLLALPPISAFFFYRFSCTFAVSNLIDTLLGLYYYHKLQPLYDRGLTQLLIPPTFYYIENALSNMLEKESSWHKTSNVWTFILFIFILFIPIAILAWMGYSMLTSPIIGLIWAIGASALVAILVARSLLVFIISLSLL